MPRPALRLWRRTFDNTVEPRSAPNWICTNMSTATPVIDKASNTLYMLAADGRLHGVDIASGEGKLVPPPAFVTPFSRNWSLNLVDGVLYTTVGRGCGNGPVPGAPAPPPGTLRGAGAPASAPAGATAGTPDDRRAHRTYRTHAPNAPDAPNAPSAPPAANPPARGRGRGTPPPPVAAHMIAMDLKSPSRPISRLFTSTARPNGAWSRAGLAWAHDSLLVQTADGAWDPANGLWGQTLLRLAPKTLEVLDYFTPANLD